MDTYNFLTVGQEAVLKAEAIIVDYFHKTNLAYENKIDMSPVTDADKEAEAVIRSHIKASFPEHGFLGEEEGNTEPDAEYQWIIDPIDGTKNFIHKLPFFSTELALAHKGKIVLGISNAPILKRKLHAVQGEGAYINGNKVSVSKITSIQNTYLSIGSLKYFISKGHTDAITRLSQDVFQCRSFGDTWSYHYLAEGKLDVIIEPKINIWDIAAMSIIITEAGGTVSDIEGNQVTMETTSFLASNGLVHSKILEYFKK